MKTVYLAAPTPDELTADIQRAIPLYAGQTEYQAPSGEIVHRIGDIPTVDASGQVTAWAGLQHANIYTADDFNEALFLCKIPAPTKPFNVLAI